MTPTHFPRILLVEDQDYDASAVSRALRDHFGDEAIEHCRTLRRALARDFEPIDLVLADMQLPDASGLEALDALLARRPGLPVILMTGQRVVESVVQAIRGGACDCLVKTGDYLFTLPLIVEKNLALGKMSQENARLQDELRRSMEEVRVKNQQLEAAIRQLQAMAATDPLTGLANRRAFAQAMARCFAEAQRYGHDLACLMIDLDGFTRFNDTQGHQPGDQMLQRLAQVLQANCRQSDVPARFGGDEFVVLLPHTDARTAEVVAHRLRESFREETLRPAVGGSSHAPEAAAGQTLSLGLASLRSSGAATPERLLAAADQALYQAKAAGRDRLVVYRPGSDAAAA